MPSGGKPNSTTLLTLFSRLNLRNETNTFVSFFVGDFFDSFFRPSNKRKTERKKIFHPRASPFHPPPVPLIYISMFVKAPLRSFFPFPHSLPSSPCLPFPLEIRRVPTKPVFSHWFTHSSRLAKPKVWGGRPFSFSSLPPPFSQMGRRSDADVWAPHYDLTQK